MFWRKCLWFSLKNIDEIKIYFLEEIEQNELIRRKNKNSCKTINYIIYFLILASTITGCISVFTFASLLGVPVASMSSAMGLKVCPIDAGIKKYKSIILKKEKET